jgi:hypothetical protein
MAFDNHPGDQGSATSTAAAATINHVGGVITTEALATATGVEYSFALTNTLIKATSLVFVSVYNGTNTTAGLTVCEVTPAAGSCNIKIKNTNAGALNGTIVISFIVF